MLENQEDKKLSPLYDKHSSVVYLVQTISVNQGTM
jgi:hypothetical protein